MRGVYSLKTLSYNGTAPLFQKLVRTFSAVSIVFLLILLACCAVGLSTHLEGPEFTFTIKLLALYTSLFCLALLAVLAVLSRSALTPLNQLIEWVNRADNLDDIGLPDHTSSEIQEVYRILNNTLERLRKTQTDLISSERLAAVGKTTQMLAHDVRKPFSMLKMALQVMESEPDGDALRRLAGMLGPEVGRAMTSVESMLSDIMEFDAQSQLVLEPASPESLISASLNEVFRLRKSASVEISYSFSHEHQVSVDALKIARVFTNIVENAVEAMSGEGRLWFRTEPIVTPRGYSLLFCIGNSGSYIPPERREHIFEAFFTAGKRGGTGLGLAIAHKLVTLHGGTIRCDSDPENGTELQFTLPTASTRNPDFLSDTLPTHSREIAERFERAVTSFPSSAGPEYADDKCFESRSKIVGFRKMAGRKFKVELIDDEPLYLNGLMMLLNRDSELADACEILPARTAKEGLEIAVNSHPDVVICDIDLGDENVNGFDIVSEIRKLGSQATLCVHSNRSLPSDYSRAIEIGADAFLPKPLSRAHLLGLMAKSVEAIEKNLLSKEKETHVER